jgi:uncharacterized membrane protein
MKPLLSALLGAGVAMLAVWLSFMSARFYRPRLGDLLAAHFKIAPVLAFYAIDLFGVMRFVDLPAVQEGGRERAAGGPPAKAFDGSVISYVTTPH